MLTKSINFVPYCHEIAVDSIIDYSIFELLLKTFERRRLTSPGNSTVRHITYIHICILVLDNGNK